MKRIELTKGKTAIVDDDDFENLSKYRWYCSNAGYAVNPKHPNGVFMHRILMGFERGKSKEIFVDHINGNKLDNRKSNLRLVDKYQNQQNRKNSRANTSGFKGVAFMKSKRKWWAKITVNKQRKFLGYFETAREAGLAYNQAAKNFFGEYAKLNNIVENRT